MVFGPVGIRCPEHASAGGRVATPRRAVRRAGWSLSTRGPFVTQAFIAINLGVYVLELFLGGQLNGTGNEIYANGVLAGPFVADGEWWRLGTAMFLHYGPVHLGLNMLVLWVLGQGVEDYFGHLRYALVYLAAGLAGSAGALIWSPNALTVGASGAIWGIMGAALVLERRRIYVFGGQAMGLLVLNLVITFLIPGVSIGGHLGGLAGGVVATFALMTLRRTPALATLSVVAIAAAAVAVAVVSVA
jgi:membrane associated rhomboid family serine protease